MHFLVVIGLRLGRLNQGKIMKLCSHRWSHIGKDPRLNDRFESQVAKDGNPILFIRKSDPSRQRESLNSRATFLTSVCLSSIAKASRCCFRLTMKDLDCR